MASKLKLAGILSLTLAVAAVLFVATAGSLSSQTPSDSCRESLTGDGSISGQWTEGCWSEVSGRGYARYYSFTLDFQSAVTITLESQDADTYLYVRRGETRLGDYLYQNDNYDGITKSQVQATLVAGTYTIEATTYSEGKTGSFILTVAGLGATGPAPPGPDRDALVALYNATNGPNWVDKTNWLSDEPLREWYGVTTDGSGRVTRLDLNTNQLTGKIPPELGSLSNLQWLEFGNDGFSCGEQGCEPTSPSANRLSGEIPSELGNLANLWWLNLRGNRLDGEIPAELGQLANLGWLFLEGNQLSGQIPAELGQLTNLRGIVLSSNRLSGEMPSKLANLANLRWLNLGHNQLSGEIPTELAQLANLTGILLPRNRLSGEIPSELGNLANLQDLWLSGNQLSGEIPSELGSLANLQDLSLGGNQLSGEIPSALGDLANLLVLWLVDNQLSGGYRPNSAAWPTFNIWGSVTTS